MDLVRVGMAELKVGTNGDRLQALGLGSCIGLVMFDSQSHIGGLAHIMLPDSSLGRNGNPVYGKYANTGVPKLLEEVIRAGARQSCVIIKMAGGAEMFSFAGNDAPRLSVGHRNIIAVHEQLDMLGLKVNAEDVGGNHGRTLEFDLSLLRCTIKVIGKEIKEL
ncbi:chemotaxis protein CheD [bacterium]|nr:chemotaxis protein CheD [bacterium]